MKAISRILFLSMLAVVLAACSSNGKSPDTIAPVITLTGDNLQILAFGEAYVELGATASDNRSGDLTTSIVIDATSVDTSTPGDYTVTYNVADAAGNAATVTRTVTVQPPVPEQVAVTVEGDIKQLIFKWDEVQYTEHYRLMENPDGHSGFTQVGEDVPAGTLMATKDIAVHLFDWVEAQYVVEACNVTGCSTSDVLTVTDVMLDTIGYFKASNTDSRDGFGHGLALSSDGKTLAVGAFGEDSCATGINGNQNSHSCESAGAVYLYRHADNGWYQQAYIKASNSDAYDYFGRGLAVSADGNTLAVAAAGEDSRLIGINRRQDDNSAPEAGAVFVFRFEDYEWHQQAYIKASNAESGDRFGELIDLSADGNTLVVGTTNEDSNATGINGDQDNHQAGYSGAAYLFRFNGTDWYQQAFIKASNTDPYDRFGDALALSADGNTLAVSAPEEGSPAQGINGYQGNDPTGADNASGAAYIFRFTNDAWYQQAYVKASNATGGDRLGQQIALSADGNTLVSTAYHHETAVYVFHYENDAWHERDRFEYANHSEVYVDGFPGLLALSGDGNTLAIGAAYEDSGATGINGDRTDNSRRSSGAVYVFRYGDNNWQEKAFVKASNTDESDLFAGGGGYLGGGTVQLSVDGNMLAVAARGEDSCATGIDGGQYSNSCESAGAVYVY